MADEAPKLIQIAPKGGEKKDGFNLVTERVVAVNPESRQLEVELLAYDGKTVLLDVAEEALEDLKKIKAGDGATIRVVEEGGKRVAKSFKIRPKDPNTARADAMLLDLKDAHWLNRKYRSRSPLERSGSGEGEVICSLGTPGKMGLGTAAVDKDDR